MTNKILKFFKLVISLIYLIIVAILKTIFVDIFKNIRLAWIYSFNPEKRNEINREMEASKLAQLLDERLKVVERLLYAVYSDSEYIKTNKGKSDLTELKKGVK